MNIYQDPGMDPTERINANLRHDAENHSVSMWPRAKYRGEFGYPPEPKQKRKRIKRVWDGDKIQYGPTSGTVNNAEMRTASG